MPYDPLLSTTRDVLRFYLNDTDDNAPLFGMNEAAYDAAIDRVGAVQTFVTLAQRKIVLLGSKWTDGDVSKDPKPQIDALTDMIERALRGEIVFAGQIGASTATGPISAPDLTTFKEL